MSTQMQKVTYYIETHLDEELDIVTLAKVAGYSHFHFCRIFKLHVGESAMSYVARLKLERAASELVLRERSMIEVALDAGYQTPTGFLKAFKIRFGTTPTAYKESVSLLCNRYKELDMKNVKIVEREEVKVVFTRELGEYMRSSEIAWKRLSEKMHDLERVFTKNPPSIKMSLGEGNGEALGICHDDPKVTDENNLRYDAALAWSEAEIDELANYGFETKSIAGGRYAMTKYKGKEDAADRAWYGLYAWLEQNGYTYRDEPSFEKYINAWRETDPSKIVTEVYIPIV